MTSNLKLIIGLLAFGISAGITLAQGVPGGDAPPRWPSGRGSASALSAAPLSKDDAEKRILGVLERMNRESRGMLSVPRDDGRFLRLMVEGSSATNVVELGTSQGYSALWMAMALRKTGGKLTTFEIDAEKVKLARENFKQAGVDDVVTVIEGDAHKEVSKVKGTVDLIFLDADKEGYADYLKQLLPSVRPGGIVVAHNIDPGRADPAYVQAITTNPNLDTVFGNFGSGGISVTLKKW